MPANPLANKLAHCLMFPDDFMHMDPSRRFDLLKCFRSNHPPGWGSLLLAHNKQMPIDRMRMSKRVDMQEMLDDPVRGGEWDWPLRLIARWSVATDVYAPRMFLLNKQCEYAWRLAVQTNEIDINWYTTALTAYCRAESGTMPCPEKPFAVQYLSVHQDRKAKKQEYLMRGWELVPLTGSEWKQRKRTDTIVEFMGAADVQVPPDAVVQGPSASFVQQL